MQSSKEFYEKIAAYLLGELESDALKLFESEMASDPKLKQEVELHKSLSKHISNTEEKKFVKNISQLTHNYKNKSRNKNWLWLAVICTLAIVAFLGQKYLLSKTDVLPANIEETIDSLENKKNKQEDTTLERAKTDVIEQAADIKNEPALKDKKSKLNRKTPREKIDVKERQTLAMADFEPNKSLELLLNGTTRGLQSDFTVLDNIKDQNYSNDIPLSIKFSGIIDTRSTLLDEDITLYIFTNKVDDYDAFRPVNISNPTLEKANDGYKLIVEKSIVLKPGLYYYILETTKEEELIYIEKFSVE